MSNENYMNEFIIRVGEERAAILEQHIKMSFRKPAWMPKWIFMQILKLVVINQTNDQQPRETGKGAELDTDASKS